MAHDLVNFLAGVRMLAKSIRQSVDLESLVGRQIAMLDESAMHAAEICEQLQILLRQGDDGEDVAYSRESIDLSAMVRRMTKMLDVMLPPNAVLKTELATGLPRFGANSTELQQVLLDLFTNATDALSSQAGCITIRTSVFGQESKEPYVLLEVADTGCGMDEETIGRIFEPSFTTKPDGHGLGMASVVRIMDRYQGSLAVDSEPGQGTVVRCSFPCQRSEPALVGEAVQPPLSPITILLVEDNEAVRTASKRLLETSDRCEFIVLDCGTGQDALELVSRDASTISAIVLDVNLPDVDGLELLHALRARSRALPILGVSGTPECRLETGNGVAKFDGWLTKPFDADALIDKLLGLVSTSTPKAGPLAPFLRDRRSATVASLQTKRV